MDTPTDVESLRAALKGMARKDVLRLCASANLRPSTVQKFRAGLITDPGAAKVLALIAAIQREAGLQQVA